MKKIKIIIDGSNIAFAIRNSKKKPKIKNLEIVINFLENIAKDYPIEFKIIVDASLRYQIDSKAKLEELERIGKIMQTPCKHTADEFMIEYAQRHPEETIIISNDRFSEYNTTNLSLCNFVIMFDEVITNPSLKQQFEIHNLDARQENVCKV